jgi:hypothetical protein
MVVPPPPATFADVAAGYWAFSAIEAIAYNSITLGCATNPLRFCPDGDVGRDEMAVFLERATRGINYPFAPTGVLFADVPISHWAVGPIEQLYNDGITLGCATDPLRFCPDGVVTRAEVAVFLLRARFGPAFQPASATGLVFADVPATYWAAAWIEEFARQGYTTGCRVTPNDFVRTTSSPAPRWPPSCNGFRADRTATLSSTLAGGVGLARPPAHTDSCKAGVGSRAGGDPHAPESDGQTGLPEGVQQALEALPVGGVLCQWTAPLEYNIPLPRIALRRALTATNFNQLPPAKCRFETCELSDTWSVVSPMTVLCTKH